ncbi:MAG: hypothetical protein COV76_04860 [Candidatus Omnitrophica bacterium CG11_big_fil_rev_8_21_14_0_20_64_10]|nr:MAG: hypothetical protein COV76_04860 [Candidatus Omnitrophica bacterium CG11_big_fil_rev_8_21_14_0_20_64_10]
MGLNPKTMRRVNCLHKLIALTAAGALLCPGPATALRVTAISENAAGLEALETRLTGRPPAAGLEGVAEAARRSLRTAATLGAWGPARQALKRYPPTAQSVIRREINRLVKRANYAHAFAPRGVLRFGIPAVIEASRDDHDFLDNLRVLENLLAQMNRDGLRPGFRSDQAQRRLDSIPFVFGSSGTAALLGLWAAPWIAQTLPPENGDPLESARIASSLLGATFGLLSAATIADWDGATAARISPADFQRLIREAVAIRRDGGAFLLKTANGRRNGGVRRSAEVRLIRLPAPQAISQTESAAGLETFPIGPLKIPVRVIYFGHAGMSAQDEQWLETQMEAAVADAAPERPVHLWLERAAPLNFPGMEQIAQALLAHDPETMLLESDPEAGSIVWDYLREQFDAGVRLEERFPPEEVTRQMAAKGDPLSRTILRVTDPWRAQGRTVLYHVEASPWEAVQDIVRRWCLDRRIKRNIEVGNLDQALEDAKQRRQYRLRYIPLRDAPVAGAIAAAHHQDPTAVHLGLRGGGHRWTTDEALRRNGVRAKSFPMPLNESDNPDARMSRYLFSGAAANDPDRLDLEEMMGIPLTVFIQTSLRETMPARNAVNRLVAALPEELLREWAADPVSRSGGGSLFHLGRETWIWLGLREQRMTGSGPDLYDQIQAQIAGGLEAVLTTGLESRHLATGA